MTYEDIRRYLSARCLSVNKSFIDVIQKAFNEGDKLDLTPIQQALVDSSFSTHFVKPPSDKTSIAQATNQELALPSTKQKKDAAPKDT